MIIDATERICSTCTNSVVTVGMSYLTCKLKAGPAPVWFVCDEYKEKDETTKHVQD